MGQLKERFKGDYHNLPSPVFLLLVFILIFLTFLLLKLAYFFNFDLFLHVYFLHLLNFPIKERFIFKGDHHNLHSPATKLQKKTMQVISILFYNKLLGLLSFFKDAIVTRGSHFSFSIFQPKKWD